MAGLFRICRRAHSPMDPGGSLRAEGRWHPQGLPVLYFCASLPMCILELRANQVPFDAMRADYHHTRCETDPALSLETLPDSFYAADWTRDKAKSQAAGLKWLQSGRSLFLAVRCAPLSTETNYLINPAHPGFASLVFMPPKGIPLDPRIV